MLLQLLSSGLSKVLVTLVAIVICAVIIRRPKRRHTIRDLGEARILLKESNLQARASPNRRLVLVFGIENAFTTTKEQVYQKFLADAKQSLSNDTEKWKRTANAAIAKLQHPNRVHLVSMVQQFVFRMVMVYFFPQHQDSLTSAVPSVTRNINFLWVASKLRDPASSPKFHQKRASLLHKLTQSFSLTKDTIEGPANPLNLLLPAYETLWRVVLRCFLETRFRSSDVNARRWLALFSKYLINPSVETFKHVDQDGVSIQNIVFESLRLYPPTSRIHRRVGNTEYAVDVEYIQRDSSIWGDDGLEFRPARWHGRTKEMKNAFLPFGAEKFQCPAVLVAPMIIGILVGALLHHEQDFNLCEGDHQLVVLEGNGPLKAGRTAYESLYLCRRSDISARAMQKSW